VLINVLLETFFMDEQIIIPLFYTAASRKADYKLN